MKPLTVGQLRAVERIAASSRAAADTRDCPRPWREYFARGVTSFDGTITAELGCADGTLLAAMAERAPRSAFVGIDWKYADVARAADRLTDLANAFVLRASADDWASTFAPGELNAILLFHPEPNVEPDQARHRLFAEPFLIDAARSLRPGGRLMLKTDHVGAFAMALATVGEPQPDWTAVSPRHRRRDLAVALPAPSAAVVEAFSVVRRSFDLHDDPATLAAIADRSFARLLTPYEARFVARRRPIFYLELERRAGPPDA